MIDRRADFPDSRTAEVESFAGNAALVILNRSRAVMTRFKPLRNVCLLIVDNEVNDELRAISDLATRSWLSRIGTRGCIS